ncbi:1-deoxy-D-xylulose 5-phosphate reductoisomerase [Burkholderiales bacterium GJ-E10]|nr:1-deoxy-D-xylulose 5-phosphate reductoisomerase [Burkholderiales bacterium GJ-E10]
MQHAPSQGVSILGATGSIGASTLDVIARHPDRFRVIALTAQSRVDELARLCVRFRPRLAVIGDAAREGALRDALRAAGLADGAVEVRSGPGALVEAAQCEDAQIVVAAIVGAAGLLPSIAAARAGKRLLLANKESVVCAGALLLDAVRTGGATLLPVDSEHNAIHQCLAGAVSANGSAEGSAAVRRLILTASGGPFRQRRDFAGITPEEACAHPNWSMGRKISVDSATLMNKGLEVIEASWLFGFGRDRIDVVVHPQSVIHSMVEFGDGSVLAQLGTPDMRTPIAYCLGYPERIESGSPRLDFLRLGALQFEAPDLERFPCLGLAYRALAAGPAASITLNAANEVAVNAFLERRLSFLGIAATIECTLDALQAAAPASVEEVLEIDAWARSVAEKAVRGGAWTS